MSKSIMNKKQIWDGETNKNKMKTEAQMQMIMKVYSSASQFRNILQSPDKLGKNINEQSTHPETQTYSLWDEGPNTD